MKRLLFDAPRRAGNVRQSIKQAAALLDVACISERNEPDHPQAREAGSRVSVVHQAHCYPTGTRTHDCHEYQRVEARAPERGKTGMGSGSEKIP